MKAIALTYRPFLKRPSRRRLLAYIGVILIGVYWVFCLPDKLFDDPLSTVVESSKGDLLGARIASDGQWRFPALDSVPYRFEQCLLLFEDEYFYEHPGCNPVAMSKALYQNITTNKRRGGSTLTQQLIRLSRKNTKRTYTEKVVELFQATRAELRYSKKEILNMYATYAPFGGNVVGLETASWRYFGMPAQDLSWGQSAALAVLPNNPSMVRPGRNVTTLSRKRNNLLKKLWERGIIDQTTYELALLEALPGSPQPLPQWAPHLTDRIWKEARGTRLKTSIDLQLQQRLQQLGATHYKLLKQNEIYNLAVVVMDVQTKEVLGYLGNAPTDAAHHKDVDIITKARSTGSVLKPFLYSGLLDQGMLLPQTLVADIPTSINGYQPYNFDRSFAGAVPAHTALASSLNVPAVRLLRQYGLDKFYNDLKKMQLGHLDKPAAHYGLSLILGGAESSLWEVTKTYAGLAHTLNTFTATSSEYPSHAFEKYSYRARPVAQQELRQTPEIYDAGAIYNTFETLQQVNRPEGDTYWSFYEDAQPIAWKTGTSFGFKDAWAVGVTPQYAIGVWVGNADGEGRPGITGIKAAAPLFFDVLRALPNTGAWFKKPYDALVATTTCAQSGAKAGPYCTNTTTTWVPQAGDRTSICAYHSQHYLSADGQFRVNSKCYELEDMLAQTRFSLPPQMAFYYAQQHPEYEALPPFHPDCSFGGEVPMAFLYPKNNEGVILPVDFDEMRNEVILKVAHSNPDTTLYWYLDDTFVGSTTSFHELAVLPSPGRYVLTIVDSEGNEISKPLEVRMTNEG
ncbi:MAG: penicillin-binding protein 1C [Dokdonia sp.]